MKRPAKPAKQTFSLKGKHAVITELDPHGPVIVKKRVKSKELRDNIKKRIQNLLELANTYAEMGLIKRSDEAYDKAKTLEGTL